MAAFDDSSAGAGHPAGSPIQSIIATAKAVVTDPTGFYAKMPKSGGFVDPLIFAAVMAAVAATFGVALSIVGLGFVPTFGAALVSVVLTPIFAAIFGFVGAGVLFAIWRLLGSQESYETAYRCGAYMMAISPITTVLNIVPYLGVLIALGWSLVLVLVASERVHSIPREKARLAFGVLFGVFALMSISSQMAARKIRGQVEKLNEHMEKMDEMSPEDAGKAVGEFLKGLQKSTEPEPNGTK